MASPDDDFGDLYPDLPSPCLSSLHGLGSLSRLYLDDSDDLSQPSNAACEQKPTASADAPFVDGGNGGSAKDGVDTDSEDDIHIILDPIEQKLTRTADEVACEDSDDGEDFIILARHGQTENQDFSNERLSAEGKDSNIQGEKVHGSRANTGVTQRAQFPVQPYRRNFQYLRTPAHGRGGGAIVCPAAFCPKSVPLKCGKPKVDWSSNGNGLTIPHRMRFTTWCNNSHRSHFYGSEYCLPANKTIFDVDIESIEVKPWRHHNADVSDYFNYGFDESSWKDYCNKLTQFRMERKLDNKVKVYESSSLIQVADTNSICDLTKACSPGALDHMDKYPTIHAIQVGGGVSERHSSVDIRERSTRESDAIFLIDVNSLKEESASDDNCLEEQGISKLNDMSPRSQLDLCRGIRESGKSSVTSESQDCFVRHTFSGPATPPERIPLHGKRHINRGSSHSSSSLNDGSHALLERQAQQSVAEEVINMQSKTSVDVHESSDYRKINKLSRKIDGNKGGFADVLLRAKCKKRGNKLAKRKLLHQQKASSLEAPLQKWTEPDATELNLGSDCLQKTKFQPKNKYFPGDLENAGNHMSSPVDIDGGRMKSFVKTKFRTEKMLMKDLNPQDRSVFLGDDAMNQSEKIKKMNVTVKVAKSTCRNVTECRNLQQNLSDKFRVAVNGNQGTKHTLLRCFMSKTNNYGQDIGKSSLKTGISESMSIHMLSKRENVLAQCLEARKKVGNMNISYISEHCSNQRNYNLRSRNEQFNANKLQHRSALHLGSTALLSNDEDSIRVFAKQRQKIDYDEGHEEAQFDSWTTFDMSSQSNKTKLAIRMFPKLKSGSVIKQRQLDTWNVGQGKKVKDRSRMNSFASTELEYNINGRNSASLHDKKKGKAAMEFENGRIEVCIDSSAEKKNVIAGSNNFQSDTTCNNDYKNPPSAEVSFKVSDSAVHAVSNVDTDQDHWALTARESPHVTLSGSSHDESEHRGRSKFERWASHSEQVTEGLCSGMIGSNRIRLSTSLQMAASRQKKHESKVCKAFGENNNGEMTSTSRAEKRGKISKKLNDDGGPNDANVNGEVTVTWLREKIARRRERFQMQIEEEAQSTQTVNDMPEVIEMKAERPIRKRRWCES